MDTDGTWNRPRHSAQFVTVDKRLALAVRELVLSLGHRCTLREQPHQGFKPGTHYLLVFTPRGCNPFRLKRKADLVDVPRPARSGRRVIVSIEPTLTVPTKCIAVDSSDRTYLCTDAMIPTHNTGGEWNLQTSAGHVHGVYPEAGLQMAAYRNAKVAWLRHGERVPMPATAEVGVVLHLRPEGYRLYPVRCGELEYRYFRHAQMVDEWSSRISSARADDPVIGKPLVLPAGTGQVGGGVMATALTPTRKQALLLLDQAESEGRSIRISNETSSNAGYLHWMPARWLVETGLAEETRQPTGEHIALTRAGRDVVAVLKKTTTAKDS